METSSNLLVSGCSHTDVAHLKVYLNTKQVSRLEWTIQCLQHLNDLFVYLSLIKTLSSMFRLKLRWGVHGLNRAYPQELLCWNLPSPYLNTAAMAASLLKESLNYDLMEGRRGRSWVSSPTASLAVVPNYPGSWRISDRAPPINAYKFSKVSSLQAALI